VAAAADGGLTVSAPVAVRLVSVDDVAELTALVAQNLAFLAPWPQRSRWRTGRAACTGCRPPPSSTTSAATGAGHNGFTLIGLAPSYLEIAGRWQDHLLFQRVAPT